MIGVRDLQREYLLVAVYVILFEVSCYEGRIALEPKTPLNYD